jgi:hypothetical protein
LYDADITTGGVSVGSGADSDHGGHPELELPPIVLPTTTDAPPHVSLVGLRKIYHPNPSSIFSSGKNLLQQMDDNVFAEIREKYDVHYPFSCWADWQLAKWLTNSSLPRSEIDAFLRLDYVSTGCLSVLLFV